MKNSTLKFCAMLLAICTSTIHLQAMDEWDGNAIAQGFYSGTGTKADPYRIFTAAQFLYFIQQTKDGNTFSGQYVELCNDISFRTNAGLKDGGDFYGDFDGNDHTIQVNEYYKEIDDYVWCGWTLFNLYGSMHDVQFVRANEVVAIYTGGILYNCKFEFPNGAYHREWTVGLKGGTIANCVSSSASSYQYLDSKVAQGFVGYYDPIRHENPQGYCLNCYFPIESKEYNGYTICKNYFGTIESCGEEAGNDWVQSHTEYDYKSWPLTFNPNYPEYQIKEQPQTYNPSVVCPNSDEALYQWCYQEKMPMTFEDITFSSSTQTKNIEVPYDNMVLSFYFEADGYVTSSYKYDDIPAWISINGEKIVNTYDDKAATYSCQLSAGTCEISCMRSDITNIRLAYPTELLANEISSTLSKRTIMERPGAYFCQVSYGEGCDVMYSDYANYEKLLTIDDVTYVINEDTTATMLWAADKAVNVIIPETVSYDGKDYPVTSISSKAFVDCTSLASVKCKALGVPELLGGATFEGLIPSNVTLYVLIGYESAYSAADGWKDLGEIIGLETVVELVDGQIFVNNNDKILDKITYTRTLPNLKWNALFVPFEVSVDDLTDKYDIAYINDIHSNDTDDDGDIDNMEMEVIKIKSGTLNASHPYLIRAKNEAAKAMTIVVNDATLYSSDNCTDITCSSVYTDFEVKGTYEKMTSDDLVGCYAINTNSAWAPVASGAALNPFRLYLTITNRNGSPVKVEQSAQSRIIIRVQGEDTETGIMETENEEVKTEIFDLSGRKVLAPQKGGIYLVNGKKLVW